MIPTRIHGIIDYLAAILLIVAPFLFGFANGGAAQWVPTLIGVLTIIVSLITRYELSILKLVPMPAHLVIDAVAGVLLATSPWLFSFAGLIWWPHVLFGIIYVIIPALTQRHSHVERATV